METKAEKRAELENRLGNKCFICGSKKAIRRLFSETRHVSLSFHRKDGKKHLSSKTMAGLLFIEAHIDEFTLLCSHCHGKVHHSKYRLNSRLESESVLNLASVLA